MDRRMLTTLASSLALSMALRAYAQVDPIENYLSSAEQKATAVVNAAGSQGRGIAMEAGQAVLNSIASFRSAYSDSLNQTEAALSGQRAALFRDIRTSTDRLELWRQDASTDVAGIATLLSGAISNIPLSKDIPRISRLRPLFLAEGGRETELVAQGLGLSNGEPFLATGGQQRRPNTETDGELRFALPIFTSTGNGLMTADATLTVFERKTRFFFFSRYVPHAYRVRLTKYPSTLGDYSLTPKRRVSVTRTQQRTTLPYRCESPRGEGTGTLPISIVPTPGWLIDVGSISYARAYSNHGSYTMLTTSAAGFTAQFSCTGWGRITGPFGVVVDAGQIGVEQGVFNYVETRSETELQDGPTKTGALVWGNSLAVSDLPGDTESVLLNVTLFTGQALVLDTSGTNAFFDLAFNPATKVATLSAKSIESALHR